MSMQYNIGDAAERSFLAAGEAFADGHLDKAARLIRQALSDCQRLDPQVLKSAISLSDRYLLSGDYWQAACLLRAAIDATHRFLGAEHPHKGELEKKLALALWNAGGLTPTLLPP